MPQMAPLSWLTLMMYFLLILILFNSMIYSLFNYTKSSFKKNKLVKMNWKW